MAQAIPAAILAAGSITPALHEATGASAKALIEIGDRPIIDRMLAAAHSARSVSEVRVLCVPDSELQTHVGPEAVPVTGPEFLDTLHTAVEALGEPERFLILTGDLPLLTPEAIDAFCAEGLRAEADLVYAVCRREDCERQYPGGQRTYIRLRDGAVTGANLAILTSRFVHEHGDRLAAAFSARKRPVHLAGLLGLGTIIALLTGHAHVPGIVAVAERALHARIHVVFSTFAEVGFDVDKPSNLETVQQWLVQHPGA